MCAKSLSRLVHQGSMGQVLLKLQHQHLKCLWLNGLVHHTGGKLAWLSFQRATGLTCERIGASGTASTH